MRHAVYLIALASLFGATTAVAAPPNPKSETVKEITLETVGDKFLPQAEQVLRITNNSIYDLKDIEIQCSYVSESGVPLRSKSEKFLLIFNARSYRDVLVQSIPTQPDAQQLVCGVTEFEYVNARPSPPPVEKREIRQRPVINEWAVPGRSKTY